MEEKVEYATRLLSSISGFNEFVSSYDFNANHEKPIIDLIEAFANFRNKRKPFSKEETYVINKAKQVMLEFCHEHNSNMLFFFDSCANIDGTCIDEFRTDFENTKSGKYTFIENKRQDYKTWTQSTKFEEHIDNGIILKYQDCYHPLIYSTLGKAIINNGYNSDGLTFILKGVQYALKPSNPFWHSPYGVIGCAECLWEFIRMLTIDEIKKQFEQYHLHLFKLLFLYLSRAIAACEDKKLLQGMDLYRNRANFVRDHYSIFMTIFAEAKFLFTNMDIQYLSDCFLGFRLCSKLGVSYLGEELLNDSKKMYQYGSLSYLNEDNGYKDIENVGWLELVERGRQRSNAVAEKLIMDMQNQKLTIDKIDFAKMSIAAFKNNSDAPRHYNWSSDNDD